jgi:non-heme chloroperoxidase
MISTNDGTQMYYKDWGKVQALVFSDGGPLRAEAFGDKMFLLTLQGDRRIAHERRTQGRSSQPLDNTVADDPAARSEGRLDPRDATGVGHRTGGGELVRCIVRNATLKVCKGAPRGLRPAHKSQVIEDPLAFSECPGQAAACAMGGTAGR